MSSQTIGDQRGPAAAEPQPAQADSPAHEGTQASAGVRIPAQARAPQAETAAAETAEPGAPAAIRPTEPAMASARVTAAAAGAAARTRVTALAAAGQAEPARGPALRRLVGVCVWAAILGLTDLLLVISGLVTILGGSAPSWYEPVVIGLGLGGIALAVTAFVTIQFRIVPWIFMTLSSGVVLASLIVTAAAT